MAAVEQLAYLSFCDPSLTLTGNIPSKVSPAIFILSILCFFFEQLGSELECQLQSELAKEKEALDAMLREHDELGASLAQNEVLAFHRGSRVAMVADLLFDLRRDAAPNTRASEAGSKPTGTDCGQRV